MDLHIIVGRLAMPLLVRPKLRSKSRCAHRLRWQSRGVLAVLFACAGLGLGCESGSHGKDASPSTLQRSAQVSVRVDVPSGGAASVSLLAFRADATDVAATDVLGAVDPLVAASPESACELRDVAGTARSVRAQGGTLSLYELGGVSLLADGQEPLRPAPRVYPPLADVVSGVIAEAGPKDLAPLPESFTVEVPTRDGQRSSVRLRLPHAATLSDANDTPLDSRTVIGIEGDLVLRVVGPPGTFLELRPFGAPSAIACAVPSSGWVVVPHDLLAKLVANAGPAPVSFEAVWRDSRLIQDGSETRVSFEVRSSAVLELRP